MTPADIRCRRERLGLTVDALAQALGIDERNVRRWEQGTQGVSERNVELLGQLEQRFDELVETLGVGDLTPLITYTTDDALWAAHPELRPLPARLHRVAAAEAAVRGGGRIAFADSDPINAGLAARTRALMALARERGWRIVACASQPVNGLRDVEWIGPDSFRSFVKELLQLEDERMAILRHYDVSSIKEVPPAAREQPIPTLVGRGSGAVVRNVVPTGGVVPILVLVDQGSGFDDQQEVPGLASRGCRLGISIEPARLDEITADPEVVDTAFVRGLGSRLKFSVRKDRNQNPPADV